MYFLKHHALQKNVNTRLKRLKKEFGLEWEIELDKIIFKLYRSKLEYNFLHFIVQECE